MKRNDNEKDVRHPGRNTDERTEGERQQTEQELSAPAAAAALWSSLSIGERPMLSGQQSMEAAGMLGNQNVLGLIEKGAQTGDALQSVRPVVDTMGLAETLSGQPDGAVCDMAAVFGA